MEGESHLYRMQYHTDERNYILNNLFSFHFIQVQMISWYVLLRDVKVSGSKKMCVV